METISPSMVRREEALEKILVNCDLAVIVGCPGEASCEALTETALRRGRAATIVRGPQDLENVDLSGNPKIALSAGAFALDDTIRDVARAIVS